MERWTHAICDICWGKENPDREPVRIKGDALQSERCCFCGEITKSGIYVRKDPVILRCKGNHYHYRVGDGSLTFADAISKVVIAKPKKEEKATMVYSKTKYRWPFMQMKTGQSFLLPETTENFKKVYHTAGVLAAQRGKKYGVKFISRKVDGGHRFWRVK